jgi:hypothetical protein
VEPVRSSSPAAGALYLRSWWIPSARDLSVLNSTVSVVTMTKKKGKVSFYPLTIDTGYDDTNERNWYIKNWMKKVLKMI